MNFRGLEMIIPKKVSYSWEKYCEFYNHKASYIELGYELLSFAQTLFLLMSWTARLFICNLERESPPFLQPLSWLAINHILPQAQSSEHILRQAQFHIHRMALAQYLEVSYWEYQEETHQCH